MTGGNRRRVPFRIAVATAIGLASIVWSGPALSQSSDDCAMCHENLARAFEADVHGRIRAFETLEGVVGCVSCHGDGTAHMESGGDAELIRNWAADEVEALEATCGECHRSGALHDWPGSAHDLAGVGCADCHDVHAVGDTRRAAAVEVCTDCHRDVRVQFEYPSHHPLREGHMDCTSCHQPHGSSTGMLLAETTRSELCTTCHAQFQGPFLFEHEPVSEGCDSCHTPHGAVANNLLVQNEPFLCLQCHEMHFHAGLEGNDEDATNIPAYDATFDPAVTDRPLYPGGMVPNPGRGASYKMAFTTKCSQCHTHVHGTDSPSQAVPGLGRGLMR